MVKWCIGRISIPFGICVMTRTVVDGFLRQALNPPPQKQKRKGLFYYSSQNYESLQSQPSSSTTTPSQLPELISIDRSAVRHVLEFQYWAGNICGVQAENGFAIIEDHFDGKEDWYAVTTTGASQHSKLLTVPGPMILSSSRIRNEYHPYISHSAFEIIDDQCYEDVQRQFYLFLRILVEYELGSNSPYHPWFQSLPRKYNTAVSMDNFCMSCLPPYIKQLCYEQRDQLSAFSEALQEFPYISQQSKANVELLKFVYNIVFTRSFPVTAGDGSSEDLQIVPVVDYINYGYPPNAILHLNDQGDCEVYCTEHLSPGQPLRIQYGPNIAPTNPSKLLAQYGFLNEEYIDATYCKLLFPSPSQQLLDVGYKNPDTMVIYTETGALSQQVWDVLLYSLLEQQSFHPGAQDDDAIREQFYNAVIRGDETTRCHIHSMYQSQTCSALLSHVDTILTDVHQLTQRMINCNDAAKHPRLPLLLKHHSMVTSTFRKARIYILNVYGQTMYNQ